MKTNMKMMIALATAAAGLAVMAPMANAQMHMGGMDHAQHQEMRNDELQGRIDNLRDRINGAWRSHQIDHRQFDRLNGRLNAIVAQKHRDERSGRGIDRDELARLNGRLDDLSRDVHWDRH